MQSMDFRTLAASVLKSSDPRMKVPKPYVLNGPSIKEYKNATQGFQNTRRECSEITSFQNTRPECSETTGLHGSSFVIVLHKGALKTLCFKRPLCKTVQKAEFRETSPKKFSELSGCHSSEPPSSGARAGKFRELFGAGFSELCFVFSFLNSSHRSMSVLCYTRAVSNIRF